MTFRQAEQVTVTFACLNEDHDVSHLTAPFRFFAAMRRAAMERKEGDVRRVADVNDILADKPVRFVAAVLFDLVYFRNSLADLDLVGEAVILLEQLVDIEDILLISRKNVEQYDLMSLFSQRGSDKKSR